jgi:hypothetical protein
VRARFNLSSRKFSTAVDVIKRSREMRLLIGLGTDVLHLSDQHACFVVEQWCKLHPSGPAPNNLGTDYMADRDWDAMQSQARVAQEVNAAIVAALTPDEIADLQAIFYQGRNKQFCEHYEQRWASIRDEHCRTWKVNHLMEKTNFRKAFSHGVAKLGRPGLAAALGAVAARPAIHRHVGLASAEGDTWRR